MRLQVVTKETVLQSSRNEYNKYEWTKTVNRLASYREAIFYQDISRTDWEVFYCVFLDARHGIRLIKEVCYMSMMSNAPYCEFSIKTDGTLHKSPTRVSPIDYITMTAGTEHGLIYSNEF